MACNRAEGNESPRPPWEGKPQLVMTAPLTDLPDCEVPPSYSIRHFQPGDQAAWDEIIRDSFKDPNCSFDKIMKGDKAFQPERVLFVCCDSRPVATAAAWPARSGEETQATCIWLDTTLLTAQEAWACKHRLRRCTGWSEGQDISGPADRFRIPAIKIYLKLGYSPSSYEASPARWRAVFEAIGRPDLIEKYRSVLDGPISRIGRRDG